MDQAVGTRSVCRPLAGLLCCSLALTALSFGSGTSSQAQATVSSAKVVDPTNARQMRDAIAKAEHGNGQGALAIVNKLLEQQPEFVPALKLKAALLEAAGESGDASLAYAKALRLAPHDPELLLKAGVADLVQGDTANAVLLLTQRLKALPKDEEGLYYLAQAYHLQGNDQAALRTIKLAEAEHPASVAIWQKYGELLCSSGDSEGSLDWLKKAQKADPSLPRINFDLAVASYNSMDLNAAVDFASREIALESGNVDAVALLAAAKVKLADWKGAEPLLQHVLATRKDDAATELELGHCQLELKQYDAAVETLERTLRIDPTLVLAHFYLSRALNGMGKTDEAAHEAALHRQMMQQMTFTLPKAELQRAAALSDQARKMLSQGREDDALQLFRQNSAGAMSTAGSPYVSLGAIYLSMGEPGKAQRALAAASELDPNTRGAHTYLGIIALQQADLSLAEREFQAELAVDPNHPLATAEMGEVRYRQGRWSDAVGFFVKSKTAVPELLYMLCDAYFHLGKDDKADVVAESLAAYARGQEEMLKSLNELLVRNGQAVAAQRIAKSAPL